MFGKKRDTSATTTNEVTERSVIAKVGIKIGQFLKKHIKLWIVLAIILAVVLYVRHNAKVAMEQLEAEANKPVTSTVSKMDLQQSVSVTGTLKANETKVVTSTIGGTGITGVKVAKVNYEVGDYVNAGDIVVEFDGDDYDRKVAELNAQYNINDKESAVNIADLQQKIVDTQKEIDDIQKWLDANKKYYDNLIDARDEYQKYSYDPDTVARFEREKAIAASAYNLTIEGYEAKQDQLTTYQNTIVQTQNQIEIAQLKQEYAKTYTQQDSYDDVYESKDKTHVSSPISGYILTMNVEAGNNYTQGNTVFTIADTSGYIVEATVNEYDIATISEGLPAVVKFEATGDEEFKGDVSFVSLASEGTISEVSASSLSSASSYSSSSSTTASYKVEIKMTDSDDRFRVGMTAKASIVLDSVNDVFACPYDCIQQDDDGSYFVNEIADDGTKNKITVTRGLESDYYVEISGDGLKEGMTVEAIVEDAPSTNVMDYMMIE